MRENWEISREELAIMDSILKLISIVIWSKVIFSSFDAYWSTVDGLSGRLNMKKAIETWIRAESRAERVMLELLSAHLSKLIRVQREAWKKRLKVQLRLGRRTASWSSSSASFGDHSTVPNGRASTLWDTNRNRKALSIPNPNQTLLKYHQLLNNQQLLETIKQSNFSHLKSILNDQSLHLQIEYLLLNHLHGSSSLTQSFSLGKASCGTVKLLSIIIKCRAINWNPLLMIARCISEANSSHVIRSATVNPKALTAFSFTSHHDSVRCHLLITPRTLSLCDRFALWLRLSSEKKFVVCRFAHGHQNHTASTAERWMESGELSTARRRKPKLYHYMKNCAKTYTRSYRNGEENWRANWREI